MIEPNNLSPAGIKLREELLAGRPIGSLRINFAYEPARSNIYIFTSSREDKAVIGYRFKLISEWSKPRYTDYIEWAYICYVEAKDKKPALWVLEVSTIPRSVFVAEETKAQEVRAMLDDQISRAIANSGRSGRKLSERMQVAQKVIASYNDFEWKGIHYPHLKP
jgi:hypothetical protein